VGLITPTPTATISANPTTVISGGTTNLAWSSTNATGCNVTKTGGVGGTPWTGTAPTAGNVNNTVGTTPATYTITCTNGSVLDVLLDLRPNSPTYLKFTSIELSKKNRNSLYIPTGIAHGFQSLEENTEMLYLTDGIQSKECEVGIKWDSFGFDWPHSLNQISERDKTLPSLNEYIETLNK
jgi:hypothetical protein